MKEESVNNEIELFKLKLIDFENEENLTKSKAFFSHLLQKLNF